MDIDDLGQALHVVSDGSIGGSVKVALDLSGKQFLVNEDPISCGPAPATDDLSVWRSTRESFIRDIYIEWPDFSFDEYANVGLLMNAERLGRESLVVVWVALGLPDQLLLAWVVYLYDRFELDLSNLSVVQFEKLRPNQRVLSMGEVSSKNIRKYCPEPRRLKSEEVEELRRAWKVYTSSDPTVLSRYIDETSPMPLLHQAVSQLVYRYPDVQSGISIMDERLLHYTVENGPVAVRVIGDALAFNETLDQVCDSYLFRRLVALGGADLDSPLISMTGDAQTMRDSKVKVTSFGQKVLAGEANHVHENGIDDWVGGVHLSTEEFVTFREGDDLILPR